MKKTVLTAYVALLLSFLLPLSRRTPPAPEPTPPPAPESAAPAADRPAEETPPPRTIRLKRADGVLELPLEDYLLGVLAAEMPASYPPEALKAQAVAARTYALYCAAGGKHGGADVCDDPGCCQAWQDDPALREKWGERYGENRDRLLRALAETRGQVLRYGGEPILAAFHASSPGATEDCGLVWSQSLPYLVSVSSPETAETVPGLASSLSCEVLDFRDAVLSAHPEADFSSPPEDWLGEAVTDGSGRVQRMTVGGAELRGTELRALFSLRSAAFRLEYREGRFQFSVLGSGHGVGMSQTGARLMAESGADYREILAHYYTGTELTA